MKLTIAQIYTEVLDTLDAYLKARVEMEQYRGGADRAPVAVILEGQRLQEELVEKCWKYARVTIRTKNRKGKK